jgi:hypothetical protein
MFVLDTTGMIAGSVQGIQSPIMIRGHKACRMATRVR